jgi:hypothetical protein
LRQAQILIHRQRGKADIDAVQIGDEVADDQEGHEALGDLGKRIDLKSVHRTGPLSC